ncbi:MAG TPA: hypothetical protein VFE31_06200 [Opitutaceae bacterium]|jgi:predicted transcriptional regulator|nr:hypothetical protein [Opitutaceae bacterium]
MANEAIPSDVRAFLARWVESVEGLEILLALREDPERRWSELDVTQRIQSTAASVGRRLRMLVAAGLIQVAGDPPQFCYKPRTPDLDSIASRIADAYRDYRATVIQLIYERPSDQILGFAKAFDLRKKQP